MTSPLVVVFPHALSSVAILIVPCFHSWHNQHRPFQEKGKGMGGGRHPLPWKMPLTCMAPAMNPGPKIFSAEYRRYLALNANCRARCRLLLFQSCRVFIHDTINTNLEKRGRGGGRRAFIAVKVVINMDDSRHESCSEYLALDIDYRTTCYLRVCSVPYLLRRRL